jgi:ribosome-binding factor A
METVRQQKVSRLLLKELGGLLQKNGFNYFPGGLITVTLVRVSPDLSLAKIFLSIFPSAKKDDVFAKLNEDKWRIRHELAAMVKNQLRIVPEIAFMHDDSSDYFDRIDNLLKS